VIPARELYEGNSGYTRPERRGVSRRTVIKEAKEKVKTIDLANRLCGPGNLRLVGKEWLGRCPLPDHEDRVPSFSVNAETGLWFCHGCVRGGDTVELARFAWGYDKGEVAVAAAYLLMEFGHRVPPRPESWFAKQARQAPLRKGFEEIKERHVRRRLFRIFVPAIAQIDDDEERRAEIEVIWDEVGPIAAQIVAARMKR
jgi:hypothetical protein